MWEEHSCHALLVAPANCRSLIDVSTSSVCAFFDAVQRLGPHALPAVMSWMRSDWENLLKYVDNRQGKTAACALRLKLLGCYELRFRNIHLLLRSQSVASSPKSNDDMVAKHSTHY